MSRLHLPLVFTFVLGTASIGGAARPVSPALLQGASLTTTDPGELSGEIRSALGRRWPGWSAAAVSTGCAEAARPAAVAFDADGDGRADIALAVQTADGARLAIVLYRSWADDVAYDLGPLPGTTGRVALRIVRAGEQYATPEVSFPRYFSNATLVASDCEGSDVAYRWTGFEFRPMALAPVD